MASIGRLHPVILAGGSGVRFWPLSRRRRPKQLLPLASGLPLVAETARRLDGLCEPDDLVTVCGRTHAAAIRRIVPAGSVVVEPVPRNTAAAIGVAATIVASRDREGVLAVLPSDHAIVDRDAFRETLRAAATVAAGGPIVTIGIRPTRPETGFGYIRVGGPHVKGGLSVLAFEEKPDSRTAARYLRSGGHLWNAGIFVSRADRMLAALRKHLPACADALDRIAPKVGTPGFARALARWFPECPSVSIDYAVMEKEDDLAVIPGDFGWSDLGSFSALPDVRASDSAGNVIEGDVLVFDSERNVVVGHQRKPVALVGCSDLVVVDAGDALLVCARDRAQEIRRVVEAIQARGDDRLL